jgi:hypothetical protein
MGCSKFIRRIVAVILTMHAFIYSVCTPVNTCIYIYILYIVHKLCIEYHALELNVRLLNIKTALTKQFVKLCCTQTQS